MEDIKTVVKEAHGLHVEKTEASKTMNQVAAECATRQGLEKPQMIRIKDYNYYRGTGWANGDPIDFVKGTKFPDRVSPCFRRLAQVVSDLQDAGCLDLLDVYFAALEKRGIHVTVDPRPPVAKDPDDVKKTVASMGGYQSVICNNADKIVDLGEVAEGLAFAPQNKFKELIAIYDRVQAGKDVDDTVQKKVEFCELYENGLNQVNDGIEA